jgi:hypothetical protein
MLSNEKSSRSKKMLGSFSIRKAHPGRPASISESTSSYESTTSPRPSVY